MKIKKPRNQNAAISVNTTTDTNKTNKMKYNEKRREREYSCSFGLPWLRYLVGVSLMPFILKLKIQKLLH